MAFNLADLLEHAVDAVPDRIALICEDKSVTYAELDAQANTFAHFLIDRGVRKGDKVGLYCRNRIEIVVAMLGIIKAGAIMVNVNYRYVEGELRYLFENSDMVALVHERRYADRVANVVPDIEAVHTVAVIEDGTTGDYQRYAGVDFDDVLAAGSSDRRFPERSADDIYLVYTGGTTGFPKGVMWRHEDIFFALFGGTDPDGVPVGDEYVLAQRAAAGPPLVRFPIPPMIHGASQAATFGALFSGGTVVLTPEFDPQRVWEAVETNRAAVLFFTGDAMARPLLDALISERASGRDYDTSSLLVLASAAALFSPTVKEQMAELLPGPMMLESIGSSETGFGGAGIYDRGQRQSGGPRVTTDSNTVVFDNDDKPVTPGSGTVGLIAKTGRIPLGYYKDEIKTAETFREINGVRYAIPGDYATVEADGTLTLLGRGSVSINSGGEKIYPEEVEAALKRHPDVFDALVVGTPDPRFGQQVAAVVHPREHVRPTLADLGAFVRQEIAGYKVPRRLWLVDSIQRTPAGKPDYRWAKQHTDSQPATETSQGAAAAR